MIDLHTEHLMRIAQVPVYLAERDVRVSQRTGYDWVRQFKVERAER